MNRMRCCALAVLVVLPFASCDMGFDIPPGLSKDKDLMELMAIARDINADSATRYTAIEPIIARARKAEETGWLCSLLGEMLEAHPDDPYGSYYLMAMAEGAKDAGSQELSLDYLRRLTRNFPDIEIKGQSIHLLALDEIARHSTDPREAIAVRIKMQQNYSAHVDQGRNHYALAEEYEKIGMWNDMYRAYAEFLKFPETVIPGLPNAQKKVSSDIAFHNSDKHWTVDNLDDLVDRVQYAIRTQDPNSLVHYQSSEFFLMNWSQETSDAFTHIPMELGTFLKSSVRYRPELEPFSNDREAFLWTTGWSWKMPTWYLYFRRVDYPADPEINGRWEWVGIYFGERL